MLTLGEQRLSAAEWLLGFDFDGTLADVTNQHRVSPHFFTTIKRLQQERPLSWGICTGRSLEFLLEGLTDTQAPFLPDYVVAQERDIFYLNEDQTYSPDHTRNRQARQDLTTLLSDNASTIQKVQRYVEEDTEGEWVSIPDDPAGIIATHEDEIQHAVELYEACTEKSSDLEYQRNTIYLRFSHKQYCKGTAVQYLQKQYHIPHRQTLVMGDNYNDLTMLNPEVAQYYGGPANSISTLKDALHNNGGFLTTGNYANGVIEALNTYL